MSERKTFICNKNWATTLNKLPSESRVKVYDAIFEYALSGTIPEMDLVCDIAFTSIRNQMDEYEQEVERNKQWRSDAGKKGMQSRWHNRDNNVMSVITKREKEKEKESNKEKEHSTINSTIKEKDESLKENCIINTAKEKAGDVSQLMNEAPVVPKTRAHFVPPTYDQLKAHLIERGRPDVDPQEFIDYYESVGWMVGKKKMVSWKGAMGTWLKRNPDLLLQRKHTLLQDDSSLGRFNKMLLKNFPFVAGHMPELVNEKQLELLKRFCTNDQIVDALGFLEDRKEYTKKHTNLYLTLYEHLKPTIRDAANK